MSISDKESGPMISSGDGCMREKTFDEMTDSERIQKLIQIVGDLERRDSRIGKAIDKVSTIVRNHKHCEGVVVNPVTYSDF